MSISNKMHDASSVSLPEYISIPVHREDYCSQEQVDQILSKLWKEKPELLVALAEEEKLEFPFCRDSEFRKKLYCIEEYLREEVLPAHDFSSPDLAILDLLHEVSRHLRESLNLEPLPVSGKALSDPLPSLVSVEALDWHNYRSKVPMSAEDAQKVCEEAYSKEPDLMVALSEQERLGLYSYKINFDFETLIKTLKVKNKCEDTYGFRDELRNRLRKMCDVSPE